MIPRIIKREHVLKALREIDAYRVVKYRASKKYSLRYEDRNYPPKFVISRAYKFATGEELASHTFGGGRQTNDFFRSLGFTIIESSTVKAT